MSAATNQHTSKLDIILHNKKQISKDSELFKIVVNKLCGHYGGVLYAIKFVVRAESPREYVDIILSMNHQPNIGLIDKANLVAAHGHNRQFGLFSPHNGMLLEPPTRNMESPSAQVLNVDLSGLEITECAEEGCHPVNGSRSHLFLLDKFHEGNVRNPKEILCHIQYAPQLNGSINTQREE